MLNSIDLALKMRHDLELLLGPLGHQQKDLFSAYSAIAESICAQAHFDQRISGIDKLGQLIGCDSISRFADCFRQKTSYAQAFNLVATNSGLTCGVSQLQGLCLANNVDGKASISLKRMLESTAALHREIMRYPLAMGDKLLGEPKRSAAPWLSTHDALWPHSSTILRMSSLERPLGIASWMPTAVPHFELGVLAPRASGGTSIHIDHDVICVLCGNKIYAASSEAKWISPHRMALRTSVVPICRTCTERDEQDPNYLREGLHGLIEGARPAMQLRFEVYEGDETDPVPRGQLRLVPNELDENGEREDC